MSTILLRKMTRKSKLNSFRYNGIPVELVLEKNKTYLIRMYFNCSELTFTDDILDELRIKEEDRIAKPGICPEKFEFYKSRNAFITSLVACKKITSDKYMIAKRNSKIIAKRNKRRNYMNFKIADEKVFSKASLQRINHGH